jgi:hypothetical protein
MAGPSQSAQIWKRLLSLADQERLKMSKFFAGLITRTKK